jgi:hypothetical protein
LQVARLQARSMFKDIRAEAEEHIYKESFHVFAPETKSVQSGHFLAK